jgi:DNA polymerase I
MTTLLVDGDEYLFKACAACEQEIRWDDQNHVLFSNEVKAWSVFEEMLGRLQERFNTERLTLCWGSSPYFRTEIEPSYKAGRARKPLCYALLRERCSDQFDTASFRGLEADDVMGILATSPKRRSMEDVMGKCIVVSQDKDMQTLPITHWDGEHLTTYSEAEADYFHMYQTLIGDKTDGYPGCPGMGPVKAKKALEPDTELDRPDWLKVVNAFEAAGLTEADAIKQARLARILRWSDWDSKEKKPILWQP